MFKLLIPLSLLIFLVSCNPYVHDKSKYVAGKIDLRIDSFDLTAPNPVGLILVDLGDDHLRYVIYQEYLDVSAGDTVFFKIKMKNGLPVASNLKTIDTSLELVSARQEISGLVNDLNFKYHNWGFDHPEGEAAHTKIHRVMDIEESDSRSAQGSRIFFTGILSTGLKQKFAMDKTPGVDIVNDPTDWYFKEIATIRDSISLVELSKNHYH